MDVEEACRKVIGAAIEVHRHLGPGLLESAYEACMLQELRVQGVRVSPQVAQPLFYKGQRIEAGYRLDLVVEDSLIVEIKAVEAINPLHTAQLLTYLRLTNRTLGLLINFNVPVLKDGLKRVVLNHASS